MLLPGSLHLALMLVTKKYISEAIHLLAIAGPLILNNFFNIGVNVADTIMAARLGATQLAAARLGSSIWITLFLAGLGVVMALGPIVAQHNGAGRKQEVGRDTRQCMLLATLRSIVVVALLQNAEPVLLSMNIAPAVAILAQGYLSATS